MDPKLLACLSAAVALIVVVLFVMRNRRARHQQTGQ